MDGRRKRSKETRVETLAVVQDRCVTNCLGEEVLMGVRRSVFCHPYRM